MTERVDGDDLKPCAFCGSDDVHLMLADFHMSYITHDEDDFVEPVFINQAIVCRICSVALPIWADSVVEVDDAIAKWNAMHAKAGRPEREN